MRGSKNALDKQVKGKLQPNLLDIVGSPVTMYLTWPKKLQSILMSI